jgi:hypothetical protein
MEERGAARVARDFERVKSLSAELRKRPEGLRRKAMAHRIERAVVEIVGSLRKHPELAKKAKAIAGCSTAMVVAVNQADPRKSYPVPVNQCRERLCPRCQSVRAGKWGDRVEPLLKSLGARAKFLTITQVSKPGETLRAARRRFQKSFRELYLHEEWKSRVRGYVAAREVTWSKGAWHYHVHVLADFEYWPQAEISALWQSITGDSFIVYVNAVEPGTEKEAIKYPLKPIGCPSSKLVELVESTAGVRMISVGGEWRKHLRVRDMEPEDCPEGHELIAAPALYARAISGEEGSHEATLAVDAVLEWARARGKRAYRAVLRAFSAPDEAFHDPEPFMLREFDKQRLGGVQ